VLVLGKVGLTRDQAYFGSLALRAGNCGEQQYANRQGGTTHFWIYTDPWRTSTLPIRTVSWQVYTIREAICLCASVTGFRRRYSHPGYWIVSLPPFEGRFWP
jgi:hypothetical protein